LPQSVTIIDSIVSIASAKMSTDESELTAQITALGEQIKAAKAAGQPPAEWNETLQQMLRLKKEYQQLTGNEFGGKKEEHKKKEHVQEEGNEKNKEKRAAKAAAKAAREAEKQANRAAREAREREKRLQQTEAAENFGDKPLTQSQVVTETVWTELNQVTPALQRKNITVRGFVQTIRVVGKGVFCLLRSKMSTLQVVCFEGKSCSSAMIKYIGALPAESVVDVTGVVSCPETPIEAATQSLVELQVTSFHAVVKSQAALPFQMEDACQKVVDREADVGEYFEDAPEEVARGGVGRHLRLDYRWLDLRTPANQAIFRIESMVGQLFREYLVSQNFVEIHTPKIIGGASEGGSDVFTLDYFGRPACLAMSPQLHKQMTAACSGFERVFESGPVFRAEDSNTRRHLCEFTGLDLEMAIQEHYDEVLQVLCDLFVYIFDGINERCAVELERVREQYPFQNMKYLNPVLKLTYAEGCQLLRDAGIAQDDYEDLSTEHEKKLGDIVLQKYGTEFYFMDKYPLSVRPFYTMPDAENPKLSNSYDFFMRGQEILSGAQRIHEPNLLEERATAHGIDLKDIESYLQSFRHGALPHGGGGIGLERVVMLFLNLPNIRQTSWFPRTPNRLAP
jgi:aspartyl-tRNA synthetase